MKKIQVQMELLVGKHWKWDTGCGHGHGLLEQGGLGELGV